MGKKNKQTLLPRKHTDGQQAHEKMLNIANHWTNANQNYNEVSSHTCQNGDYQKVYKQYMHERVWRKGNPLTLLMGMQTGTATMEKMW